MGPLELPDQRELLVQPAPKDRKVLLELRDLLVRLVYRVPPVIQVSQAQLVRLDLRDQRELLD